ncbi:HAD family hydrolase [Pseudogemmobacter faecipullorum]|uniref:HAD hydrolase-like protein n=1 Tax=Pseudogemmobacter faecipullorum TaxID=2755041 RepID=A0ABS8CJT0_9RHOB|nr:HAD family hydrolase [Pseudogemmobacter faecipullorum]MCB5409653.1 HAD hydrolase-like protein [Pseudogemmobacter faecipullorum]
MITTLGFDADDTLWQNEAFFRLTQEHFTALLRDYSAPEALGARLLAAERRNIGAYGFGVKGFTLSMIETAIEVTGGRVPASVISEILGAGRAMLDHPVDLLPHARAVVESLSRDYRLILITKGDLLHQERKLAQSGLGDWFDAVEIVSEKTPQVYERIFARHGDGAGRALMTGNSMKSDVIAPLAAGARAVHIPQGPEWELESAEAPQGNPRYHSLTDLSALPGLLERLR